MIRDHKTEIQQLLKLFDKHNYVYIYKVCEDEKFVRDIFLVHLESIKLFNIFPSVLTIDVTYKPNKYKFPLLEVVDVTSIDMTCFVGFSYLKCEKEDNVTC